MNIYEAMLLGLIQGLTEFLPVSSSGHLVIFQEILGLDEPGVTLEVLLHFGTLLSVFWVFGSDFLALLSFRKNIKERRFLLMLIVGVAVTGSIGLLFSGYITELFKSTLLVGFMLLITGAILKLIGILPVGLKDKENITFKDALFIGLLQALAMIPGISRSGTTIAAALWRGLDRQTAVKYSFMLSAPVILGATLLELRELLSFGFGQELIIGYIAGGIVAFLSGVLAIRVFIKLLTGNKFHYFSYYCFAAGIVVIVVSLVRL
jgi:undecaprenyl-diphosphatase